MVRGGRVEGDVETERGSLVRMSGGGADGDAYPCWLARPTRGFVGASELPDVVRLDGVAEGQPGGEGEDEGPVGGGLRVADCYLAGGEGEVLDAVGVSAVAVAALASAVGREGPADRRLSLSFSRSPASRA